MRKLKCWWSNGRWVELVSCGIRICSNWEGRKSSRVHWRLFRDYFTRGYLTIGCLPWEIGWYLFINCFLHIISCETRTRLNRLTSTFEWIVFPFCNKSSVNVLESIALEELATSRVMQQKWRHNEAIVIRNVGRDQSYVPRQRCFAQERVLFLFRLLVLFVYVVRWDHGWWSCEATDFPACIARLTFDLVFCITIQFDWPLRSNLYWMVLASSISRRFWLLTDHWGIIDLYQGIAKVSCLVRFTRPRICHKSRLKDAWATKAARGWNLR